MCVCLLQARTPLNFASYRGYLEVVQILLEYGAHVDALDKVLFSMYVSVRMVMTHDTSLLSSCLIIHFLVISG